MQDSINTHNRQCTGLVTLINLLYNESRHGCSKYCGLGWCKHYSQCADLVTSYTPATTWQPLAVYIVLHICGIDLCDLTVLCKYEN